MHVYEHFVYTFNSYFNNYYYMNHYIQPLLYEVLFPFFQCLKRKELPQHESLVLLYLVEVGTDPK